jgi:hypothetical protein
MKIAFNNQLEALYAIDYCVNRGQNVIKQSDAPEEKQFFDELYRVYLEKISSVVRDDAVQLGDYHRKAEYVYGHDNPLPDLSGFDDFFASMRSLQDKIVADISSDSTIASLHLDALRSYFGIAEEREINIVPSLFVNSVFGVFNGEVYLVVGAKVNPATGRYVISNELVNEFYYEFSRPFVQMALYEKNISANNNTEYLAELVTRVLEIVFSTRIYGQQYIEEALQSHDIMRLGQLRIYLSLYLENQANIYNLDDYIRYLLDAGLAVQGA